VCALANQSCYHTFVIALNIHAGFMGECKTWAMDGPWNQVLQYSIAAAGGIVLRVEIQDAREEPKNEATFTQVGVLLQ